MKRISPKQMKIGVAYLLERAIGIEKLKVFVYLGHKDALLKNVYFIETPEGSLVCAEYSKIYELNDD
jgi:uncharacterized protein YpiB (UPF0302 family)